MKITTEWLDGKLACQAGIDCIYEKRHSNDTRPRTAIEAARRCLTDDTPDNRKSASAYAVYAAALPAAPVAAAAAAAEEEKIQIKILEYGLSLLVVGNSGDNE